MIKAGLPDSIPCTSVNKVCASGLKAVMLADQSIRLGQNQIVVAGGMESMSNVPFYLPGAARGGLRMGNAEMVDGLIKDGAIRAHAAAWRRGSRKRPRFYSCTSLLPFSPSSFPSLSLSLFESHAPLLLLLSPLALSCRALGPLQ